MQRLGNAAESVCITVTTSFFSFFFFSFFLIFFLLLFFSLCFAFNQPNKNKIKQQQKKKVWGGGGRNIRPGKILIQ